MFRPCSEINHTRGTVRAKGSRSRCPAPYGLISGRGVEVGPTCSPWQPMGSGLTHAAPRGATGPPPPPPASHTPPGTASPRARGWRSVGSQTAQSWGQESGARAAKVPGRADPTGRGLQVAQRDFLPARTAADPADFGPRSSPSSLPPGVPRVARPSWARSGDVLRPRLGCGAVPGAVEVFIETGW